MTFTSVTSSSYYLPGTASITSCNPLLLLWFLLPGSTNNRTNW